MRKRALSWAAALLLSAVAGTGVLAQAQQRAQMDKPVTDFKLRDLMKDDEVSHTLSQYKGKTVLLTWVSYNCSVSWRYEKRLGKLLQDYGKKDVVFLAVRSNANDTIEGMRKYAEARNLEMPVLYDEKNTLADYYGVRITPTFVVIDKNGVMRYRGSFDDDADEGSVKATYVRDGLEAVLGGKQVKTKETRPFG